MIRGLGIDVVEIARIAQGLRRHGRGFVARIAHPADLVTEPKAGARRAEYWAARFAAKEAFAKALGTGIGAEVGWRDIGVTKNRKGKPSLALAIGATRVLRGLGARRSHLALTHAAGTAVAVVVLED